MNKRHIFAACAAVSLILILSAAAHAAYQKLEWTYRVKPDVVPQSIVFVSDKIIGLQSERNVLHFIDSDTGKRVWAYALSGRAVMYPIGRGFVLAMTDGLAHVLKPDEKRRAWTAAACASSPRAIYQSADSAALFVQCADGANTSYDIASGAATPGPRIPEDSRLLGPQPAAELNPSLLGPDTTLDFQGENVSLYTGKVQSLAWNYRNTNKLAPTAALLGKKMLVLSATGELIALNPATGAELYTLNLAKNVDMRFWDELPQRVNNYSSSRLFVNGDNIFILPPSAICKFRLMPFPPEITLGGKDAPPEDSTQQWALNKAIQAWDRSDFPAALRSFQETAQIWPDSPEVLMFMGMAYSALREANRSYLDLAIKELEAALKIAPENPDVASNLIGNYLLKILSIDQQKNRKDVIELYRKMLAADPYSPVSHVGLGEQLIMDKNFDEAIKVLNDSFADGFFGPDQYNLLIATNYLKDDRPAVLAATADAMRYFPNSIIAFLLRGRLLCKQGMYQKAVDTFKSAPPDNPQAVELSSYPRALTAGTDFFKGTALGLTGKYSEAIVILNNYLDALPSDKEMADFKTKLEAQAKSGQPITDADSRLKGKTYIELMAELDFKVPAILTIAHFYYRAQDTEQSIKFNEMAERLDPTDTDTQSYVGYYYALNGKQLEKAIQYTEKSYKSSPRDPAYIKNYAVALWKNNKAAEAKAKFDEAVALDTPAEFLNYDYGMYLLDQGKRKEALEQFKKELEHNPELFEARNMVDALSAKK